MILGSAAKKSAPLDHPPIVATADWWAAAADTIGTNSESAVAAVQAVGALLDTHKSAFAHQKQSPLLWRVMGC